MLQSAAELAPTCSPAFREFAPRGLHVGSRGTSGSHIFACWLKGHIVLTINGWAHGAPIRRRFCSNVQPRVPRIRSAWTARSLRACHLPTGADHSLLGTVEGWKKVKCLNLIARTTMAAFGCYFVLFMLPSASPPTRFNPPKLAPPTMVAGSHNLEHCKNRVHKC